MKFGNLVIENFMSIVKVEVNLSDKGLVLVQGENNDSDAFESNGAGKSTMFSEAPTWAMYGETIRGQKGDKIVNRNAGKNTRVSLEVIDDNGDVYTIVRHRKHSKFKNNVHLFKGEENITGKSDKDTDQMIVDLLEMDYLTFTNSVMFGQGVTKMFASSTDKEQKAILEKMLQIDIFRHCQDLAKSKLSEVEDKYYSTVMEQTTVKTLKEGKEVTLKELQTSEAELESKCNLAIDNYRAKLESLLKQLSDYEADLESGSLEAELSDIANLIEKAEKVIEGYSVIREESIEAQSQERVLLREVSDLVGKIKKDERELNGIKMGKNVPKTCSACGQDLPSDDTSHLEKHLQDAIEKHEKSKEEAESKLEQAKAVTESFKVKLAGLPKSEANLRALKDAQYEINSDIKKLKSNIADTKKAIADVESEISKQEELKKSTFTSSIESAIESIKQYKVEIADLQKELGILLKDKELYEFWVEGYGNSGIKSVLLDSVVPFLDTRANDYLSVLADSSIEVKFHTQQLVKTTGKYKDKFYVEVINHNGDDDYKSNSGGEKRRIDIAINMALQDLALSRSNKRIDFIAYDEVFESLDELGSHKAIELLEQKAKEVGTIIVITHNDYLKQLFSQSVEVVKSNGRTEVKYID